MNRHIGVRISNLWGKLPPTHR